MKLKVMNNPWSFDQPENCAVIGVRQIVHDGAPILLVTHDKDDLGWQFWDGSQEPDPSDGVIVCFSHIVDSDPSLLELADLPPEWLAWRQSPGDPWVREVSPPQEEE